jgi:hypothetical protein
MKLVLMYVYYDKHGDIKAITPQDDGAFSKDYNHILLPLAEVEPFIMGKKNSFEYMIKKSQKITGETMQLVKKYSNVNLTRSMDNYLTKVSTVANSEPVVKIILNSLQKKINVILNPSYKDMYDNGTEDERDKIDDFVNAGLTSIHITEKNNPYNLYLTISFLPKELFEKLKIDFNYDENLDLSSSSAYTKRLVASYQYLIKDYRNAL